METMLKNVGNVDEKTHRNVDSVKEIGKF